MLSSSEPTLYGVTVICHILVTIPELFLFFFSSSSFLLLLLLLPPVPPPHMVDSSLKEHISVSPLDGELIRPATDRDKASKSTHKPKRRKQPTKSGRRKPTRLRAMSFVIVNDRDDLSNTEWSLHVCTQIQ